MALQVLGIDNIMLAVGDLAQARAFYETALGLPIKFEVPGAGILAFGLGEETPGLILRLQAIPPSPPHDTPRIWLEVPDACAAGQSLEAQGITLLAKPYEVRTGWVIEIADPWGNVIGLTDYLLQPSRGRSFSSSS